jgi:hypothetical protein
VDLSAFLERQRLDDPATLDATAKEEDPDDNDVDLTLKSLTARNPGKKGQVHQIEWDKEMDQLQRDKISAEAARGEESTMYYSIPRHLSFIITAST